MNTIKTIMDALKTGRPFTDEERKETYNLLKHINESNTIEISTKDDTPYTEGVLFHNGCELTCTEPDCTYDGEWNFEYDGIKYTVLVEVEN